MPRKMIATLLAIFVIAVAGCGSSIEMSAGNTEIDSTVAQSRSGTGRSVGVTQSEVDAALMEILISANRARLDANRPPLVANSQLMGAAQLRADDMAELGYFNHIHPLRGTAEIERLLRPDFPEVQIAELIYLNDCSIEDLPELTIKAWLSDEENRATLLNPNFNLIGAGTELGQSGWYTVLALTE